MPRRRALEPIPITFNATASKPLLGPVANRAREPGLERGRRRMYRRTSAWPVLLPSGGDLTIGASVWPRRPESGLAVG